LRRATVEQFRANHEAAVAQYRQTVLAAFQQVEDNLAALGILAVQLQQQETAVNSSRQNLALATYRYKTGIDSYLNVITAQTALLANQQTLVTLRLQQLTAGVQLIEALGGGWNSAQKPWAGFETAPQNQTSKPQPAWRGNNNTNDAPPN
ncbi:MAG: TolC family protein, partial [Candidatus Omnitrophica bacterium]|nr:TolC family protein [Candidatus Omnitrophota bacterium]